MRLSALIQPDTTESVPANMDGAVGVKPRTAAENLSELVERVCRTHYRQFIEPAGAARPCWSTHPSRARFTVDMGVRLRDRLRPQPSAKILAILIEAIENTTGASRLSYRERWRCSGDLISDAGKRPGEDPRSMTRAAVSALHRLGPVQKTGRPTNTRRALCVCGQGLPRTRHRHQAARGHHRARARLQRSRRR